VAVRVLDCEGAGSISNVVAGTIRSLLLLVTATRLVATVLQPVTVPVMAGGQRLSHHAQRSDTTWQAMCSP